MIKKLLLYAVLLTAPIGAMAAQQPVTVGTSGAKASLDTNFGNIKANFTELYSMYTNAEIDGLLGLKQGADADLNIYAGITPSANVQSLLGAANYGAIRGLLDLEAGTDFNAYDADLTSASGASAAGASKYWGTNASSVAGFYDLPTGGITGYATATPDLTSKLVGVDGSGVAKSFTTVALKTLFGTSVSLDLGALSDLKYGGVTMLDDTKGNGDIHNFWSADKVFDELALKQATLVSGTSIKTINGVSVLGSGDMTIVGGGGTVFPTGIDIDGGDSTASFIGDIDGGASI